MDCTIVRVFTRGGSGGNHLGVIRRHLQPQLMQEIAADLGFSETIFIDTGDPALPNVRIFTPGAELPFAGHPLVGAAWGLGAQTNRLHCGIGDVGVRHDGPVTWIDVPLYRSPEDPSGVDAFLRRAGFPAPLAVHRVGLPLEYVIGELADVEAVAGAQPAGPGAGRMAALPPPWNPRRQRWASSIAARRRGASVLPRPKSLGSMGPLRNAWTKPDRRPPARV